MESVLDLAIQLINTESVTPHEKPMADFLANYLEQRGWLVTRQVVEDDRENILALRPGVSHPTVLFNTHTDTVPPFIPASTDETWLKGRGACDTKGLIAAQLVAAGLLLEQNIDDFGLLYVVGEEVDHCGMKKTNELGLSPAYLIVGEPTESKLAQRQKGIYKFRLVAKGKAAHSGYPHTGVSAIDALLDVLQDLRKAPWPGSPELGDTTLNIGLISGGRAANVVPDQASAEIMVRVVTDEADIAERIEKIVDNRVEVHRISSNNPYELTVLEGYETDVVSFNTDIPYFAFQGKALLWGPGSILDAHTADEKIRITDLQQAPQIYAELAKQCLELHKERS